MSRTVAICALLCSVAHHQGFGIPVTDGHSIVTHLPNPIAVVLDSTLYTISKTNRTLSINSSDSSCKFSVDPFDENVQGRIKAAPLKKVRKIVVWGIQSGSPKGSVRSIYYTLLVVDPLGCKYVAVPLAEDTVPASWPPMLPQIVAYDREFYVFYPTHQQCAPCLYDHLGKLQETSKRQQLRQQSEVPAANKQFWIRDYFTPSYRYLFHAYNFANGTSFVELVDDYWFTSVRRVYLNHPVDAASVAFGTYQNTAYCYIHGQIRQEVTCARLNKRLLSGLAWNLPKSNYSLTDLFIEVDSVGNTFIGTISSYEVRFYFYDVDGVKLIDWNGRIGQTYSYQRVNGVRNGDEYCVDAVVYADRDAQSAQHTLDCFNLKKYIN